MVRITRAASMLLAMYALGTGLTAQEKPPEPASSKGTSTADPIDAGRDITRGSVGAAVDPRTYVIEAEDVVEIKVWREPEMSGRFVVRPDGKISMLLVGDVVAGGSTPDQLQARVIEALQALIKRPQVTVSVADVRSKRYFISGEVGRPGAYQLISKITVLEALSLAGGLREFADAKGIRIMRGTDQLKFNYRDVIKGKKREQNVELKPGDHIIVP